MAERMQVILRVDEELKSRWVEAAQAAGQNLNTWLVAAANAAARVPTTRIHPAPEPSSPRRSNVAVETTQRAAITPIRATRTMLVVTPLSPLLQRRCARIARQRARRRSGVRKVRARPELSSLSGRGRIPCG